MAGEVALFGAVALHHVVDHHRVPRHLHPGTHLLAGLAVVSAAGALGADRDDLGMSGDPWRAALGGLAAATTPAAALGVAALVPGLGAPLHDPRVAGADRRELVRRVLLEIPVGTAVYEELVFRGALLGLLLRRFGPGVAVGVSSVLFGFWHMLPALEDRVHNPVAAARAPHLTILPTVGVTALAGVGFALLRLRTRSVLAPMVCHATTNIAALLAAVAVTRRPGPPGHPGAPRSLSGHRRPEPAGPPPTTDSTASVP